MKNTWYLIHFLSLLLWGSFEAKASHILAAEISYECIGNYQYEVTFNYYSNCQGINPSTAVTANIIGLPTCSNNMLSTISLSLDTSTIIPLGCPSLPHICNGGTAPAVRKSIYKGTFILPVALRSCDWKISVSECCRGAALTNVINPSSQGFYTEVISSDTIPCNSSPQHFAIPIHVVPANSPVSLSTLMADPDGDSLVYSLASPLSSSNNPIPFSAGLTPNTPFYTSNNSIAIDSHTGEITFSNATASQEATFNVLVQEYRNGALIGTSLRSMYFYILSNSSANVFPVLDSVNRWDWSTNTWAPYGRSTTFDVCIGEALSFQLFFSDVDTTQTLSINNLHTNILAVYPNAIIQTFYPGGNSHQLILQVDILYASLDDFVLAVSDNACPIMGSQMLPINLIARSSCGRVEGYVFADVNNDCTINVGEDSLGNYLITFTNGAFSFTTNTDHTGYYNVPLAPATYTVSSASTYPYRTVCTAAQTIVNPLGSALIQKNIPIQSTTLCPYMEVDIAAAALIRCFDNQYVVNYCNRGTDTASMASIEVTLDSLFVVDSSSLPISSQNGFTYVFNVGNVAPLQCGSFLIYGRLDTACTSPLGRTFCATAYVHPDTTCGIWGGSLLEVTGKCQNDSVGFKIKNRGHQGMATPTLYHVIEDNILLHQGTPISLAAGASTPWIYYPATGAHYRLAIDQETGYPWGNQASANVEGCLSSLFPNNPITIGLVNTFPLDDGAPYIAIDCQPSIGSYDPNDKQAFPVGYGGAHAIEPNVDLLYRIRFQNTGTAPARDVVILDTLSTHLDVTTLIPTTASHAYTWRLKEGNILEVTFANIQLPDSASSPLASQGFVDFKIKQQPNNPLGTVINNTAAIYFDRNAPIITNTVFHTIDENFILFTQLPAMEQGDALTIQAFPNPFDQATTLRVEGSQSYEVLHLQVYNALGQLVGQASSQNGAQQIHFQRQNLEEGIYFYRLEGDGAFLHAGQLMVR